MNYDLSLLLKSINRKSFNRKERKDLKPKVAKGNQ